MNVINHSAPLDFNLPIAAEGVDETMAQEMQLIDEDPWYIVLAVLGEQCLFFSAIIFPAIFAFIVGPVILLGLLLLIPVIFVIYTTSYIWNYKEYHNRIEENRFQSLPSADAELCSAYPTAHLYEP